MDGYLYEVTMEDGTKAAVFGYNIVQAAANAIPLDEKCRVTGLRQAAVIPADAVAGMREANGW